VVSLQEFVETILLESVNLEKHFQENNRSQKKELTTLKSAVEVPTNFDTKSIFLSGFRSTFM